MKSNRTFRMLMILGGASLPLPALADGLVTIGGGVVRQRVAIEGLEDGLESRSRTGWEGNLGFERALSPTVSLVIRAGLSDAGGRVEVPGSGTRLDLDLQEVTVPLLLQVRRSSGGVRPYAFAGPAFVWRRRAEVALVEGGDEARADAADDVRRFGFGLTGGVGMAFGSGRARPFVEAQYVHGLTGLDAAAASTDDFTNARTRSLQVRVGLAFGR
jgi:hypothetical protein